MQLLFHGFERELLASPLVCSPKIDHLCGLKDFPDLSSLKFRFLQRGIGGVWFKTKASHVSTLALKIIQRS